MEEVSADDSGMSEKLTLDAPPLEYSMEPSENQPFAQYTVKVTAPGYRPVSISGVQVFSEQLALQQVRMAEENEEETQIDSIVIPVNTLFGRFSAENSRVRDQAGLRLRGDRVEQSGDPGVCRRSRRTSFG